MKVFTDKQLDIIKFENRYTPKITTLEGAVRSGKTVINLWLWLKHVKNFKGKKYKFIMTGYTIPSLKRNVLDEMSAVFGIDTSLNKNNEFMLFGNLMCCFGTDKIDSYKALKGFTSYGWLGNEVTESHLNSIDQAFKRCSGNGARIFWDTNPSHPQHPIKVEYIDRDGEKLSDGRIHIKNWHFVLDDNTFLPPEYIESLKRTTPKGMHYDRDILGLWVAAEGMIYKDFNYSVHVIDAPKYDIVTYYAGVDWGYDHPGVIALYGEDYDGNTYRLSETVEREKGLDFWIDTALSIKKKHGNLRFYCGKDRPDYIAAFRAKGIDAIGANTDVVPGISYVAGLFKTNKKYIIKSTNKHYLSEIYNYRWKPNSKNDEPIKENDDAMDSDRYAEYSHKKAQHAAPKQYKPTERMRSKVRDLPL